MSTGTLERQTVTDLLKIKYPKNAILRRLKDQILADNTKDLTVARDLSGYSRMHNRHNRS